MLYNGIKILEINPVIYLGEKSRDCMSNSLYVKKELDKVSDQFEGEWGIECPIEDLVFIYLPNKENSNVGEIINNIYDSYDILKDIFDNVKVNFYLDRVIEGLGNSFDMTISEFTYWTTTLDK